MIYYNVALGFLCLLAFSLPLFYFAYEMNKADNA